MCKQQADNLYKQQQTANKLRPNWPRAGVVARVLAISNWLPCVFDLGVGEMNSQIQAAIKHGERAPKLLTTKHGMILDGMHDMLYALPIRVNSAVHEYLQWGKHLASS